MSQFRFCFISQEYPPETGWGGIGSYTFEMAHGLAALGHRVVVISRAINSETINCNQGVELHRILPAPDWSRKKGGWRLNRYWPGFAWAAAVRLDTLHKKEAFQLVEIAECRADGLFLPCYLRSLRRVVRLHTAWAFVDQFNAIHPDLKKKFIYWQEKRVIQDSHSLSSPSKAMVDKTSEWMPGIKNKFLKVIPNPINAGFFKPNHELQKENSVIFVGRLEKIKGIETIIPALGKILQRFPDLKFRFLGSTEYQINGLPVHEFVLNTLPDSLKGRVIFQQVERSNLPGYLSQASVCVLTSIWENFPYAILEAMSCGVPVVATQVGGIVEMVEDGITGLLIPPSDPEAFVDAVGMLLENMELQRKMGMAARQRVESLYSTSVIIPRMLEYYSEVIGA